MGDKLRDKLIEQTDGMDYSEIFEFLDISLDQVIEDKIESLTDNEILDLI